MKGYRIRSAWGSRIAARWHSRRDAGFAFAITLGLFFAMTMMIAAMLQGNVSQRSALKDRQDRIQVRYMAESVLHEALHALSLERKPGGRKQSFGPGEAAAAWTVESDDEAVIEIEAVSRKGVPGAAREAMRVRVRFDPGTGRPRIVARTKL